MAREQITNITSDFSGRKNAREFNYSIDGTDYTIDLTEAEIQRFKKAVSKFVDHSKSTNESTKKSKAKSRRPASKGKRSGDAKAIREWAASVGIEVAPQGRISKVVADQYAAAHNR
jgi:hypothetical protein